MTRDAFKVGDRVRALTGPNAGTAGEVRVAGALNLLVAWPADVAWTPVRCVERVKSPASEPDPETFLVRLTGFCAAVAVGAFATAWALRRAGW